jgi:hypothetical protein
MGKTPSAIDLRTLLVALIGITEAFKRFWRDTPKEDKKKN